MVVNPPPSAAAAATSVGSRALKRVTRHFIFGYGSLICPQSRFITAPTLAGPGAPPAVPCVVRNLERGWNARIRVEGKLPRRHRLERLPDGADRPRSLEGWTAVGVRVAPGESCAGVLLEVDESELALFDERERGYNRLPVKLEHVERVPGHCGVSDDERRKGSETEFSENEEEEHVVFRRGDYVRKMSSLESYEGSDDERCPELAMEDDTEDINVWVYVQLDYTPADRNYPIKQSYVDIILRGCLSVSEAFARSFIDTTVGWWHEGDESSAEEKVNNEGLVEDEHHTWIDDRHFPLYIRSDPDYSKDMGHVLDDLMKEHHPEALARRRRY